MRPVVGLLVHGASALVLALAALASGPLVSFVAAPVAFLLVAQALAVRHGSGPDAPRRSVGLGLATLAFSLLLLAAAGPGAALLVAAAGLGLQPLSQALQEYPEMDALYRQVHDRLAPAGGTVQMLGRIGYGPQVAPSPRWPLEAKLVRA